MGIGGTKYVEWDLNSGFFCIGADQADPADRAELMQVLNQHPGLQYF